MLKLNRFIFPVFAAVAALVLAPVSAWADKGCEDRIRSTGMVYRAEDPSVVCDENPSAETQDCMVELLTKGKGKLKNEDFLEIYGLCTADPGKPARDCVLKGLMAGWNEPGYRGVKILGPRCLRALAQGVEPNYTAPAIPPSRSAAARPAPKSANKGAKK